MGKKKRQKSQAGVVKPGYTQADLGQARFLTIALGAVFLIGLLFDGWCFGRAHFTHEHVHVPLPIAVLPFIALAFMIISWVSWRSVKKSMSESANGAKK
jgi:hypothetical protein